MHRSTRPMLLFVAAGLVLADLPLAAQSPEPGFYQRGTIYFDWSDRIRQQRLQVQLNERALAHLSPRVKLANARQRLDEAGSRMQEAMLHSLVLRRERVNSFGAQLDAFNPLSVLARGYAVVRKEASGEVLRRVAQVTAGEQLTVRVSDGEFKTHADEV